MSDTAMTREEKEREAIKALTCLTLATDFEVAKDVQTKVMSAIAALREELAQVKQERDQARDKEAHTSFDRDHYELVKDQLKAV